MTGTPVYSPSVMLYSSISLLGLVVLYFWLYKQYRVDLFRQRLFALRQDLFDLARTGVLSFDHPAYGLLRSTMNGFIRFGHRLTVVSAAWAASEYQSGRLAATGSRSFQERWNEATANLDPEVRGRLEATLSRVHFLVADHLLYTSLLLTALLIPIVCLMLAERGRQTAWRRLRQSKAWARFRMWVIEPIDSAALAQGGEFEALAKSGLLPRLALR